MIISRSTNPSADKSALFRAIDLVQDYRLAIAIYKRDLVGYEIVTKAEEALLIFLESE